MLSDLECLNLLQNQYDGVETFDFNQTISGVSIAVKVFHDEVVVCLEGTHDKPDVEHDFESRMIYPPELNGNGYHEGFWQGLIDAMSAVRPLLPIDKIIKLCGHSLGAGRVNGATAILLGWGYTKLERIKFGCPRSNDASVTRWLTNIPCRDYWNYTDIVLHDPIVDVPRYIPELFPYDYNEPKLKAAGGLYMPWGVPIGYHKLLEYVDVVKKCQPSLS